MTEQRAAAGRALPVPGPISDFEDGSLGSKFGLGWAPSTDEIRGGSSTVELIPEQGALTLRGEVRAGATSWSGAIFFPGAAPMSPADVSAGSGIRFKVRGQADRRVQHPDRRHGDLLRRARPATRRHTPGVSPSTPFGSVR